MTVRSKLLASYTLALVFILLVGAASMNALLGWRAAAHGVEQMYAQEVRSALLRGELLSLISAGRAHLEGDRSAKERFATHEESALDRLRELTDSALTEIEREHITGLRETHVELVWVFNRIVGSQQAIDYLSARDRLDEISEEVADDVAVLNSFYHTRRAQRIAKAEGAGSDATIIITAAAIIVLLALLAVLTLTRRWVTQPALLISRATERISAGDFTVRLARDSHDEWAKLGEDINNMAHALQDMERRLSERERMAALGEVAAYAAHNIRNPLAGIRAAAQVTAAEYKGRDTALCETLSEIIDNIDRLDIWVQRMMEFTRPLNIQRNRVDLNKIATDTCELAQKAFTEKEINLTMDLAPDLPLVSADSALLEQALIAIINNAFQSAGQQGEVRLKTGKRTIEERQLAEIQVSDNGPGVAPELRGRLFTLFASGRSDGSGLGLAQARRIVEAHGGSINLESPDKGGATFTLTVPLETTAQDIAT